MRHFASAVSMGLAAVLTLASVAYAADAPKEKKAEPAAKPAPVSQAKAWNFDKDTVGQVPPGWIPAETAAAGHAGQWRVVADKSATSAPNAVALTETHNTGSTFNLLLADGLEYKDLTITMKVKAGTGQEDQGGGPAWRVRDTDNYYIARWNPLENNLRLYVVVKGKRKMLATTNAKADPSAWHELKVQVEGDRIQASLDGQHFVETQDASISAGGTVGLWTKADAATAFDDVKVDPIGAPKAE